jgi:phosphatidylinositol glycan class B
MGMKFNRSPYYKWFLLALFVQLVTAWFSIGSHHPDEHFQILEFANYKMGYSPSSDLSWEYARKCRPAIQPLIVYSLGETLSAIKVFNPFREALILRLMMAVLTWWITCRMVMLLLPEFVTKKGKQLFVWCSLLLWFVPYIDVRFSAENVAGACFWLGCILLMEPEKRATNFIVSGILLGLSLYLRIQMSFGLLGLGIWLLFIKKLELQRWLPLVTGGVIALGLGVLADHWFYGVWTISPINYFDITVLQHKAAEFGTSPWWDYLKKFLESAIPPISIFLLFFFSTGLYKKRLHVMSLICLCFIIEHMLIGHKELRFLFPISFAFIFLSCTGIDMWLQRFPEKAYYKWLFPLLATINLVLLTARTFIPAEQAVSYYRYIYCYAREHNTVLIALDQTPYNQVGVTVNYYKPQRLIVETATDQKEIANIADSAGNASVLLLSRTYAPAAIPGYEMKKVYSILPGWLSSFDINNWQERSHIWTIYELVPAANKHLHAFNKRIQIFRRLQKPASIPRKHLAVNETNIGTRHYGF